jgi:hypothetical protein
MIGGEDDELQPTHTFSRPDYQNLFAFWFGVMFDLRLFLPAHLTQHPVSFCSALPEMVVEFPLISSRQHCLMLCGAKFLAFLQFSRV